MPRLCYTKFDLHFLCTKSTAYTFISTVDAQASDADVGVSDMSVLYQSSKQSISFEFEFDGI